MKLIEDNSFGLLFDRLAQLATPQTPQQVIGLQIAYPYRFRANPEGASAIRATLSPDIEARLVSLDVYDAIGCGLITDLGLSRYIFRKGLPLTLAGVAEGSAQHLVSLKGVSNPRHAIRSVGVSGLEARWISFSAQRWDRKVGVEELAILDPKTQSLWTAQATFAKPLPMHALAALTLYLACANARRILGSIRVASMH